ncbi:hypothetical protein DFAR_1410006 [Desulfarculales bacterium]
MLRWKQYLAGLVVSAGAIYLFLTVVDLGQMAEALGRMHLVYLLPCAAFYLCHYVFRALRWRYLMAPVAQVALRPLAGGHAYRFFGQQPAAGPSGRVRAGLCAGARPEA